MEKYNISCNPFEFKTVHDLNDFEHQPFLLINTQKILKTKIDLNKKSPFPIYVILLGERGIGKSSTLLYLYKSILENNGNIVPMYTNRILGRIDEIVSLFPDSKIKQLALSKSQNEILKGMASGKKVYLFIDCPDKISPKSLEEFLALIENILDIKEICVIMAINKGYYNQAFSYSEIFGKYSTLELESFNLEETEELIKERLNSARVTPEDSFKPFTEESIKHIYSSSGGIPRNIISACDLLLLNAIEKEVDKIDERFVVKILQNDFAYKIINERIKDKTNREAILCLLEVIKKEFKGFVKQESELSHKLNKDYGWANVTVRKRIRLLEKLGLLEIKKSPDDLWTNQIILRG